MSTSAVRSLKSLNMKWLVLLTLADILAALFFVAPNLLDGVSLTQVGAGRIGTATMLPVAILLVVNVLPHNVKAALVYWKPLGVLPGAEAFTRHGPSDPRVDMDALKRYIGALPTDGNEQNFKWYRLYTQVANETEIVEAHKNYLMYRDMAVLSLALALLVPLALLTAGAAKNASAIAGGAFAAQYLLTALSARWCGVRFVCNVLALHSTQRVSTAKPL